MQVAQNSSKVLELCALKIEDSCRKGESTHFEVLTWPLCKVLSLLGSFSAAKGIISLVKRSGYTQVQVLYSWRFLFVYVRVVPLGEDDTYLAIKTCCDLILGVENAGLEDSDAFKEECLNALLVLVHDDVKKLLYHLQSALNDRKNDDGLVLNVLHALRLLFFKLPDDFDYELMVFGAQLRDDVDIRVADWLNLGLDSPCPRTNVEAIKALWKVSLHVSDPKASAIVEVLMDIFMEDSDSDVLTVTIASLWEIIFMKPHVAPMLICEDASYTGMHLWSSLEHVDCKVRHAAILSAARLLLYPTTTLRGQHKLFGILLEMYSRPDLHSA
uniref:AlNc14C237G9418 protein n=1 Tax=Albugo laibachii Nc14 TaxID=890382 RepID=F0WF03_9STRA|nr:AlNc14C79G5200 [Albugo laibachii Nc14]CCA24400.1 AlNc14C237G9418 [Albugo laibachii Nc14]|eukprot:CCA24400.1 AlNc14C237G9418 [Albugo laibachii Nc14]